VNARAGDTVFEQFILRRVGYESIDVGFVGFPEAGEAPGRDRAVMGELDARPEKRGHAAMKFVRLGLGVVLLVASAGCSAYRNFAQARDAEGDGAVGSRGPAPAEGARARSGQPPVQELARPREAEGVAGPLRKGEALP
jgi:hypothetical protein